MSESKLESFDREAKELFKILINDYQYELDSVKITNNSVYHNYINKTTNLKIEISNSPFYTDYGFSIFIYNLKEKEEFNLLYNLPHEKQDKQNNIFLPDAVQELFLSKEAIDLISGNKWWKLERVLIQK